MTKKDKKIIDCILTMIGSNTDLEDQFAEEIANHFDMTPDQFSDWLSQVKVV